MPFLQDEQLKMTSLAHQSLTNKSLQCLSPEAPLDLCAIRLRCAYDFLTLVSRNTVIFEKEGTTDICGGSIQLDGCAVNRQPGFRFARETRRAEGATHLQKLRSSWDSNRIPNHIPHSARKKDHPFHPTPEKQAKNQEIFEGGPEICIVVSCFGPMA